VRLAEKYALPCRRIRRNIAIPLMMILWRCTARDITSTHKLIVMYDFLSWCIGQWRYAMGRQRIRIVWFKIWMCRVFLVLSRVPWKVWHAAYTLKRFNEAQGLFYQNYRIFWTNVAPLSDVDNTLQNQTLKPIAAANDGPWYVRWCCGLEIGWP